MKNSHFFDNFLEFIADIYDAEKQITEALPKLVKEANDKKLKESLKDHLEETKEQVKRLEKVFKILNIEPKKNKSKAIQAIIEEGERMVGKPDMSPSIRDCFIIVSAQKVEHYEIAAYGSACALIKHLHEAFPENQFDEVADLLAKSLKEEKKADAKLSSVAEGKMFMQGVNHAIEKELGAIK